MHQAGRNCHSREKCHCPNSIISSIGTSNPPELSCLTGSLFSASCYPALHRKRQDLLGSLAPKQLQWHPASRACRCHILECFMTGEMKAQPQSCMSEGTTGRWKPDKQFSSCRRMVSLPERGALQQCLPQQMLGPKLEARIWARGERNKQSCESCPHLH